MLTAGIFPFEENSHGRAGNRTRDLLISSQGLWPLDHEAGTNNTQGFLEQRKRVQLTFCKEPFVVLQQDGRGDTWLLFCFSRVRTEMTARSLWIWCMFVLASLYKRREENQLDATEWFIALIICSTCFGHTYAHHQERETILVQWYLG